MERVGVRELRRQASAILRRVAAGETVEVTDRGRPAAVLLETMPSGLARNPVHRMLRRPAPFVVVRDRRALDPSAGGRRRSRARVERDLRDRPSRGISTRRSGRPPEGVQLARLPALHRRLRRVRRTGGGCVRVARRMVRTGHARLAIYSAASGFVLLAFWIAALALPGPGGVSSIAGLLQRIAVAAGFSWLAVLAVTVRRRLVPEAGGWSILSRLGVPVVTRVEP